GAFNGNAAGASGGAIGNGSGAFSGGTATLTDVVMSANTALQHGGGISSFGAVTMTGGSITGSQAKDGGAIANLAGTTTLVNVTLDTNAASNSGGHIFGRTAGPVIVDGGAIRNGSAPVGGGIFATAGVTVRNGAVVSDNTATTTDGGGLYLNTSSPVLL